jgi:hypothetical protein
MFTGYTNLPCAWTLMCEVTELELELEQDMSKQYNTPPTLPWGKCNWYSLNSRLGQSHSHFGCQNEKKNSLQSSILFINSFSIMNLIFVHPPPPYFCAGTFYYSFQKVSSIKATAVLTLPYETTDFYILQVFLSWPHESLKKVQLYFK